METIREEPVQRDPNKIESIKARIAELEDYEVDLKNLYRKLKLRALQKKKPLKPRSN